MKKLLVLGAIAGAVAVVWNTPELRAKAEKIIDDLLVKADKLISDYLY